MLVQIVRYRSRLTDEDVLATVESRATEYLAVPGLLQKYYLRFPETGEHGGVYLWASRESSRGSASPSLRAPSRTRTGSRGRRTSSSPTSPRCCTRGARRTPEADGRGEHRPGATQQRVSPATRTPDAPS